MSGTTGTIPLNTVVADQLITSAERNAELENIGTLMDAAGCGGHSDTDSDAQIQTAPFPGSVLSKATSIAGELERLRYQLAQILGTDFWYKPASTNLSSVGNVVVPVGGVIDYPTNAAPSSSWHLADGTAISRAGYPALFSLIGTTFGIGDGSLTFNLPDYRDRMSIGAGNLYAGAATGGEATHVLTTPEIPAHLHTVNVTDPGHTHTITDPNHSHSVSDPGHTHQQRANTSGSGGSSPAGVLSASASNAGPTTASATTGLTVNSGSTGITGSNSGTTGITAASTNTGGGGAHNNLPPYLGMFKMIRVL